MNSQRNLPYVVSAAAAAGSHSLFGQGRAVSFDPTIGPDSLVAIGVSVTRYRAKPGDLPEAVATQRRAYDEELNMLFERTAWMKESAQLKLVDVILTAELHENWSQEEIAEINKHFLKTHQAVLARQTGVLTWNQFCAQVGPEKLLEKYEEIVKLSQPGSDWYNLMLDLNQNLKSDTGGLDATLKYLRMEYAAIRSMSSYTNFLYPGPLPAALARLYKIYGEIEPLPIFTRAKVTKEFLLFPSAPVADGTDQDPAQPIVIGVQQILFNRSIGSQELITRLTILLSCYEAAKKMGSRAPIGVEIRKQSRFSEVDAPFPGDADHLFVSYLILLAQQVFVSENHGLKTKEGVARRLQTILDAYSYAAHPVVRGASATAASSAPSTPESIPLSSSSSDAIPQVALAPGRLVESKSQDNPVLVDVMSIIAEKKQPSSVITPATASTPELAGSSSSSHDAIPLLDLESYPTAAGPGLLDTVKPLSLHRRLSIFNGESPPKMRAAAPPNTLCTACVLP